MDKDNNKSIKSEQTRQVIEDEEYGYSFIPELDMWLDIDTQKENAVKLSKMTNDVKGEKRKK